MEKTKKTRTYAAERLSAALLDLMREMPYDQISIKGIAARAGVARVSFYRHFDSKDDVLRRRAQRITEDFLAHLDPSLRAYDSCAFVLALLKHMRAQDDLVRLVMKADRMDIVRAEFDRAFGVGGVDRRDSARRRFISGGLYNIFNAWVRDGYEPDAAQIAAFVCELISSGSGLPATHRTL